MKTCKKSKRMPKNNFVKNFLKTGFLRIKKAKPTQKTGFEKVTDGDKTPSVCYFLLKYVKKLWCILRGKKAVFDLILILVFAKIRLEFLIFNMGGFFL